MKVSEKNQNRSNVSFSPNGSGPESVVPSLQIPFYSEQDFKKNINAADP